MGLTDKCKKAFENWLRDTQKEMDTDFIVTPSFFYALIDSMRYGVYVDFFDSVGVDIMIEKDFVHTGAEVYYWNVIQSEDMNCFEMTRHDARTKAITKANELFNNQHVSN